jgi:hypothetical protein
MKAQPGFHCRLRVAMGTNGMKTAEDLAKATKLSRAKAYRLLAVNEATRIDALTLFRIADATQFSSRWLLSGVGTPSIRMATTPDEQWMIDAYRRLSNDDRTIIRGALTQLTTRA